LAITLPAAAQYIADTGRTEQVTINPSASVADDTTTGMHAAAASELYSGDVATALRSSGIGRIGIQSEGVNTSLLTWARIQLAAVTGKPVFQKQDSVFTALGMVVQHSRWMGVAMIPVESPQLAKLLGIDPKAHNRVSATWVMRTPAARQYVIGYLESGDSALAGLDGPTQKALKKLAFRIASFLNLPTEFKIVPLEGGAGEWLSPLVLMNPGHADSPDVAAKLRSADVRRGSYGAAISLYEALLKSFDDRNPDHVAGAVAGLLSAVGNSPDYMSARIRGIDYLNTSYKPFQKSALIYMASFVAFLAYFFTVRLARSDARAGSGRDPQPAESTPSRDGGLVVLRAPSGAADPILAADRAIPCGSRAVWGVAFTLLVAAGAMLVAALVMRFILGGRMPVSNMYESITFAMGGFAVIGVIFEGIYRRGWVGAGVALTGWLLMALANSMPLHLRKVDPLVAVLNSVWLNYHVTALLVAYSAFLLSFVCCILYFVKELTGNKPGILPDKDVFDYLCYRSVQVGWPLLTLGIFLGAVWANTAWGNAWSWDPKETWALITWFCYTIYLHLRMILGWTGRRSIIAAMFGFAMVLVTYFGVSYLPGLAGGLHSYAEPIAR
jgi:cytochrome c-type biogenesis protein CcsB